MLPLDHMLIMCGGKAAEQGRDVHAERLKVNARQTNLIQYGDEEIDLSAVEQLVEKSQTRAIADAISTLQSWLSQHHNQGKTLRQLLQQLETEMDSKASSCYTMLIHSPYRFGWSPTSLLSFTMLSQAVLPTFPVLKV